jgi:hypothetical protein
MRAKVAKAANIEWKYEYRRQQNLFKKLIEISHMKAEFDNLPEEEKVKILIAGVLADKNGNTKNIKNLFEEDNSDISPKKTPEVKKTHSINDEDEN